MLELEVTGMANEEKKDFNAMLHDSKDMPKIQIITDVSVQRVEDETTRSFSVVLLKENDTLY